MISPPTVNAMGDRDRAQLLLFLRECKERPEDDVPRLVLADWLQDQGDPRGELVYLQTRRSVPPEAAVAAEMRRREMALLAQHALSWLGPVVEFITGWVFRRGLLALEARGTRFLCPGVFFLAEGDLFRWVEELRLTELLLPDVPKLASSPLLANLNTLDLSDNHMGNDGLAFLLAAEGLRNLRALHLKNTRIGNRVMSTLANCPSLAGLRLLDLSHNLISEGGAVALAESPYLNNLEMLDMSHLPIGAYGVSALRDRFGGRVRFRR